MGRKNSKLYLRQENHRFFFWLQIVLNDAVDRQNCSIGVGRFRILVWGGGGGARFRYLGGGGKFLAGK